LIVAVELPTLTFQRKDLSQGNLISAVIFGDGAAAAILTNQPSSGPRILDSESFTLPASMEALGFDLRDSGFHIVLSKELPQLVREQIKGLVENFLGRHNLTPGEMTAYILHPAARSCWSASKKSWACSVAIPSFLGCASRVRQHFQRHDSVYSAGVADQEADEPWGLRPVAGFGPGFSSEFLLLQWT